MLATSPFVLAYSVQSGLRSSAMTPSELKRHLKRVGIGQMEAARRLKVNPRTVRRWVAGDSPIPEAVAQLVALWSASRRRVLSTS